MLKPSLAPMGYMSGTVTLDGAEDSGAMDKTCAYITQSPEDGFVSDRVYGEIVFAAENMGMDEMKMHRRVSEIVSYFGLEELFSSDINSLSGGQAQLVGICAALITQPEVLLVDEGAGRLDPLHERSLMDILRYINEQLGITVIMTAHRLENLPKTCDRLIILEQGHVIADGTPKTAAQALYNMRHQFFCAMPCAAYVSAGIDKSADFGITECRNKIKEKMCEHNIEKTLFPKTEISHGQTAISVKNIVFSYENSEKPVLNGLNFNLQYGSVCALFGGNGAGKTTLLNVLAGVIKPSVGKLERGGSLFYIPQDARTVFTKSTVRDELHALAETPCAAENAAERYELCELLDMHPFDLSNGQRQKLALCLAELSKCDIILMDEPTGGLDAVFKEKLSLYMRDMAKGGAAILFAAHDADFASIAADRAVMLFDGAVSSDTDIRTFFEDGMFYTTSAARLALGTVGNAITKEEILDCLQIPHFRPSGEKPKYGEKQMPEHRTVHMEKKTEKGGVSPIFLAVLAITTAMLCFAPIERKLLIVMAAIMLETTAYFFVSCENGGITMEKAVLIAVMCAAAVSGRAAFFAFASFKPVLAVVIICGITLGGRAGFVVGAMCMLISNFIFGQGTWTLFQMFGAGLIGLMASLINENGRNFKLKTCVFGAVCAVCVYGLIVNPSYILVSQQTVTAPMIFASLITGFPFDAVHAAATAFFLYFCLEPSVRLINRAKIRYGMQ